MSIVRREYLHMAREKIDQNKLARCVRAFRAGVVLVLPSIGIVFLMCYILYLGLKTYQAIGLAIFFILLDCLLEI